MPKKTKGPVRFMITTGDGAIRVRASRLIPGRSFVTFANQLEDAIQRTFKGVSWKRAGRTWIIFGPVSHSGFQRFVSLVDTLTIQAGMALEPVQMEDISDQVVLAPSGYPGRGIHMDPDVALGVGKRSVPIVRKTKRRSKPIEDSIAQIRGELSSGRISVARAVAKLGAALDRRQREDSPDVFEQVVSLFIE